ncbi:putative phage associated protein [Neisseria gonorrhoeae]|nr:putative phage associated protein [Neisseria gonorrhoeae]CNO78138.1 putative phage associated protein [Neisseria gonorrhoeae]CNO80591.1 putative phage associated protein [Neisseria gonorrhoeae]CNP98661.1 putative phage associated protein [Neisseria gonorrhoeae]CNQ03244.1 putative phage associated protein [Neisseria gonorrhoeae]
MNGLIKNPKLIAVSVCAVFVAGAWQYDRAAQYRGGFGTPQSRRGRTRRTRPQIVRRVSGAKGGA